ncbi:acyltransferase [Parabacteroides distasonis]|uniref:Acyltransferase n=3 Tax=Parabacteroides distasonis TaxID=823 RepID=A0A3R6BZ11_PARDI|nr:acyltransferase [Parabacteroides distasonis]PWM78433.1 MAG: acyltransferase [Clostridium sp.]PNL10328.1 acyltransferase [Parabacteroides distasonis]QKH99990.1 acyltransferase [Parabacteroides distasonis]QRO18437.1 acyltransferase [Parabacteroides distasonis]
MDIGHNVRISWRANLDLTINPRGIHVGDNTLITRGVYIMAHDAARGIKGDVYIGANCFIGIASIILPGVHIGNNCIVGTGAVVTKDFPDNSIIAGNPAKRIKENTYI